MSRPSGEVTSGSDVRFYWDYVSGPNAVLLNTTQGEPDGGYSAEITIPETYSGYHYIWVRDVETGSTISSGAIYVSASLEVDPTSGLPTDIVTAEAHAFNDSTEIWFGIYNTTWGYSDNLTTSPSSPDTDEYGYAEVDVTIPGGLTYGKYTINCTDGINWAFANFTIGPSLKISVDEGPSGYQISFSGRGYNASDTIVEGEVFWDGWGGIQIVGDEIDVDSDGDISGKVVAPTDAKGEHNLTVYDGLWWAYDMFTITGTSVIEVTPTYGPPGTTMTITGYNFTQIEDTNVDLTIGGTTLGSAMTEADGTFTATATAPAKQFKTYNILAVDDYGLNATDAYKIGILAMLFYPTSGDTGTNVTVTATGFNANGKFNVTLGDEIVIQDGDIDVNETIFSSFYVPTMDPGTYQLSLIDDAGNELANPFVVTDNTTLTPNIYEAAVGYNVTFTGSGYVEKNNTALEWWVYNSTWSMDISSKVNVSDSLTAAFVDGDGNFTGVWTVPLEMLLGNTYWVNATDTEGL
ncbi:MAG: IPT/TIG domain-containing protein, partial [Candidatus Bathyarchaeota archaeon]